MVLEQLENDTRAIGGNGEHKAIFFATIHCKKWGTRNVFLTVA